MSDPSSSSGLSSAESIPQSSAASTNSQAAAASKPSVSSSFKARYARFQGTRTYRSYAFVSRHRKSLLFGASLLYLGTSYTSALFAARKRDKIHDDTYLYFKIHDGAIVEAKSSATTLSNLLFSSGGGSDEPPRIMTLFEVVKGLNWAMADDRIKGIVADFSSLSAPAVQTAYSLGLAQIEEIADAVEELNRYKAEKLGAENWRSIAFTDSFESQAQYALASAFNEIYMQPSGDVPLVGVSSQIPFFRRLIDWLGIKVQAEAREEYKSFIAQYTSERLSEPQTKNQEELINSLNDLMLARIGRNRFGRELPKIEMQGFPDTRLPILDVQDPAGIADTVLAATPLEEGDSSKAQVDVPLPDAAQVDVPLPDAVVQQLPDTPEELATLAMEAGGDVIAVPADIIEAPKVPVVTDEVFEKIKKLSFEGPFSAQEAVKNGLITGVSYRSYILDSIREPEFGGLEDNKMMGFYHYCKVMEKAMQRSKEPVLEVGVVHLMGTIGEAGEYDAGSVVRGLRQAGEDDDIGCVVLRIDSGGGGVVDSDSIDQAVQDLKSKGKVVVASFSNAAASGGYLSACHADAIMAHPSTITGSIGVAALRPVFATSFLDKVKITVQSFFTGSDFQDPTKELSGPKLAKYRKHIDEMYGDFKGRVVEGREIHPELINYLAGGRVYTGQMAFDLLAEANKDIAAAADLPGTVRLPHIDDGSPSVQMSEGQEMSPFAPPETLPGSDEEAEKKEEDLQLQLPVLGPLGRGLVDGLGGIRDAAALAAEVFLTRSLAEKKLENPELTDAQAVEEILPGIKYEITEDNQVVMPIDVDLKQFPVEKSFWQLYKEASSKGDAMTDPAASIFLLPTYIKMALASWVVNAASKTLVDELDSMGLADVRRGMGIGPKAKRRAWMRAEMPKISPN